MNPVLLKWLAQLSSNDVNLPKTELSKGSIATVFQLVFGVAGGVALIIITIAGMQFVLSQGNPQSASKARNTIIYAVIGLTIAITGFGIVTFVVSRL